jgi:hypothetical protein
MNTASSAKHCQHDRHVKQRGIGSSGRGFCIADSRSPRIHCVHITGV